MPVCVPALGARPRSLRAQVRVALECNKQQSQSQVSQVSQGTAKSRIISKEQKDATLSSSHCGPCITAHPTRQLKRHAGCEAVSPSRLGPTGRRASGRAGVRVCGRLPPLCLSVALASTVALSKKLKIIRLCMQVTNILLILLPIDQSATTLRPSPSWILTS